MAVIQSNMSERSALTEMNYAAMHHLPMHGLLGMHVGRD